MWLTLLRFTGLRILMAIPMIWVLLTLVFLLMRVLPGDPIQASLGGQVSAEDLAARRAAAGFDRPILLQYVEYLGQVLRGDLGASVTDRRPVIDVLLDNGAATLLLVVAAVVVAVVIGLPLGMMAGRFRDRAPDVLARVFSILTYAAPVFFVGLLAQLIFGKYLGLLPTSGQASPLVQATVPSITNVVLVDAILTGDARAAWDAFQHLILPALALGLTLAGVLIRLVRVNLIQSLRSDYVEAATARGVSHRVVTRSHALRNALVPVITVMGLQIALMLGGAVLTEKTFGWPGIGSVLVRYLENRDFIAVQGIVTALAIIVVIVSIVIDIVNALIDPRGRFAR